METTKVSILIPVYNAEKYIGRCIKSVCEQSYENIEIIIVNDCSEDNSIAVAVKSVQNFQKRIEQLRIIENVHNSGSGKSRLVALEHASGDYVFWLDADDWIEPNTISSLLAVAQNDNADIVMADFAFSYNKKETFRHLKYNEKNEYLRNIISRTPGYSLSIWNKLIHRNLHMNVLPEEGLNYGEDYAILPILIHRSHRIAHIPAVTYHYWQGNPNSYVRSFSQNSYDNMIQAISRLESYFSNQTDCSYSEELALAKARIRLFLFSKSTGTLRNKARNLWPNIHVFSQLTAIEKLSQALISLRLYHLLEIFINGGYKIKNIWRQ